MESDRLIQRYGTIAAALEHYLRNRYRSFVSAVAIAQKLEEHPNKPALAILQQYTLLARFSLEELSKLRTCCFYSSTIGRKQHMNAAAVDLIHQSRQGALIHDAHLFGVASTSVEPVTWSLVPESVLEGKRAACGKRTEIAFDIQNRQELWYPLYQVE